MQFPIFKISCKYKRKLNVNITENFKHDQDMMIIISRLVPFLTAWWQYRRKFVANRIQIYSCQRGMFMRERKTSAYRCLLSNRESRYFVWMSIRFAIRGTLQGERVDFFIIPFILIPSVYILVCFFLFYSLPWTVSIWERLMKGVNRWSSTKRKKSKDIRVTFSQWLIFLRRWTHYFTWWFINKIK